MAKGPLRKSIEDAAATFGSEEGQQTWWEKLKQRASDYAGWWSLAAERQKMGIVAWTPTIALQFPQYVLTGTPILAQKVRELAGVADPVDVSQEVAKVLRSVFSQPLAGEIAETLGALVTEPVLALFERYSGNDQLDPKEFARAFHGFMISLNVSGGLADTILESVTGGQVEGAGRMLNSMYWSLGLGFLGWQTLAPLLTSGLQPGLERYYNRLYRPTRFSASDLRDLYALGELSQNQLAEEARNLGWRDQDITQWIKLAFRTLTASQIFQALNEGFIPQAEATKRLRALGYDPDDIPLLYELNPKKEVSELRDFTASTARQAYREGLISVDELRSILKELKYQPREIELLVGIENARRTTDAKSLTLGQIKSAWTENVIVDAEAIHWLKEADFGDPEIEIILDTWKAEAIPDFRKLNIGTITGAYVEGIIDRTQAAAKLRAVGLSQEDAALELDLVEARNGEVFGRPEPPPPRLLTPGTLTQLVVVGLITPSQMVTRLVAIGYSQDDAELLAEAARIRALPPERPLPQRSIERAYLAGVIDRDEALAQLIKIGLSEDDSNEILDTVEAENPETFGAEPEERLRTLTPAVLEDLFIVGLITQDVFKARLVDLGYSEADADLLVQRALSRATPQPRLFTQSTVERGYLAGVFGRELAIEFLTNIGFTDEQADQILKIVEAQHPEAFGEEPEQRSRFLTAGALEDLLVGGLINANEMRSRLLDLGYTEVDADLLTTRAEQLAAPPVRALSKEDITRAYTIGVIDRTTALDKLKGLDYTAEDAEQILTTTEAENPEAFEPSLAQSTRLPSIETLTAAVKNGIITEDEFYAKAQEIGFRPQDAAMYLSIAVKNERKSTVTLSASQIGQAYDLGLMSRGTALIRLSQLGYGDDDAIMLLRIRKDFVENTDTWDQLLASNIEWIDAVAQLVNANYADQDILEAFSNLPPVTLATMGVDLTALGEALAETPGGE